MFKTWTSAFVIIFLMLTAVSFASPVPDTGQTKCYDVAGNVITCPLPGQALYGQDANFSINPMSYTKLDGSGNALPNSATSWTMVQDNVTGLIWENKTHDGSIHDRVNTYTWYDPTDPYPGTPGNGTDTKDFIDALNSARFGGHSDWRLPTIKELASIVNYSVPSPGPTIDSGYFPNTAASQYWSSTTGAGRADGAWGVNFYNGYDYGNFSKSSSYYVRAVRGGQSGLLGYWIIGSLDSFDSISMDEVATTSGSGYTDNGDGTVTDSSSGLMWEQAGSSNKTWEQALSYCEEQKLGGYTDWRLPTIKELERLVDYSRYNPSINTTYFSSTVSFFFWSSTTYANDTSHAWGVTFDYGNNASYNKNSSHYVRAVRGGQSQITSRFLGAWSDGVWSWNQDTKQWIKIPSTSNAIMIAAGKVDPDAFEDLIGVWSSGLYVLQSTNGQWLKLSSTLPTWITAGDMNNDGRDDVIGSWKNDGVYYRDSATSKWVKITTPARQLAAGNIGGTRDDLVGVWDSGLWVLYSATSAWQKIDPTIPIWITTGDMTGDKRADIIGSYTSGTWYRNSATGAWTNLTTPAEQLAAGDIDGDGRDDLIGVWSNGLWVRYSSSGQWYLITSSKPKWITTSRIADAVQTAGSLEDPIESGVDVIDLSQEGPGGVTTDMLFLEEEGPAPQE